MKSKKVLIKIILILLIIFAIFELVIYNINNSLLYKEEQKVISTYFPQNTVVLKSNSYIATGKDEISYIIWFKFQTDKSSYKELCDNYAFPHYAEFADMNEYYITLWYRNANSNPILMKLDPRVLLGKLDEFSMILY